MATATAAQVKKAIEGKEFRHNQGIEVKNDEGKPVMHNGKPKLRYSPASRPMTMSDVLDHAIVGNELVVVSKDGTKYRLPLSGEPESDEKGEGDEKSEGKKGFFGKK